MVTILLGKVMPRDRDEANKGCGRVGILALRALGHLLGQSRETGSSLALGLLEGVALCLQRDRNAGEMMQSCLLTCANNIQVVPFGLGQWSETH